MLKYDFWWALKVRIFKFYWKKQLQERQFICLRQVQKKMKKKSLPIKYNLSLDLILNKRLRVRRFQRKQEKSKEGRFLMRDEQMNDAENSDDREERKSSHND